MDILFNQLIEATSTTELLTDLLMDVVKSFWQLAIMPIISYIGSPLGSQSERMSLISTSAVLMSTFPASLALEKMNKSLSRLEYTK